MSVTKKDVTNVLFSSSACNYIQATGMMAGTFQYLEKRLIQ